MKHWVKYEFCLLNKRKGHSFYLDYVKFHKLKFRWDKKYDVRIETSNNKSQANRRKENKGKEKEGKYDTDNKESRKYIRVYCKEPCKVVATMSVYEEESNDKFEDLLPPKLQKIQKIHKKRKTKTKRKRRIR